MEYSKINTLFKRDAKNVIIPSEFTYPEFEYLKDCKFRCELKVDGTNTRIELKPATDLHNPYVEYKGRTDKTELFPQLLDTLHEIIDETKILEYFTASLKIDRVPVTIYGEGYGKKIQKCGNKYCKDRAKFIVFDIKVGKWWLTRETVEGICKDLGLDIVPIIGYFTLEEAIDYVKKGFKDPIAESDLEAEGLVLKTDLGLLRRNGDRIITKIKTCDFRKHVAVYGEGYTGPQPPNTHY